MTRFILMTLRLCSVIIVAGVYCNLPKESQAMDKVTYYSEIETHQVVVLLEVTDAKPGAWMQDPTNPLNQRRNNDLSARVLEWFKGESPLGIGSTLNFSVTQIEPVSGRIADDYGPWSGIDLESHPQILLFCDRSESQQSPEQMFPQCGLVIQVPNQAYPYAVEDMRFVTLLRQNPGFPQSLAAQGFREMMIEKRKKAGPLLGRFLIDAMPKKSPRTATNLFYDLLEAFDTYVMHRAVLLMHLVEQMTLQQDPPIEDRTRLIRAMVIILQESPQSSRALQEGIEQAYLYNTVFDPSGKPYLPVNQVLTDENERSAALTAIDHANFSENHSKGLLKWIKAH